MKKAISVLLCLALCLSVLSGFAGAVSAKRSSQALCLNGGEPLDCEKYNIDGSNYFKLRDVAMLLSDTQSAFEVGYDAKTSTMLVTTGKPYTPVGGELQVGADKSAACTKSSWKLEVDGTPVACTVYNIGGNNYFKLRDLANAVGIGVGYDAVSRSALIFARKNVPSGAGVTETGKTFGKTLPITLLFSHNDTYKEDRLEFKLDGSLPADFHLMECELQAEGQWISAGGFSYSEYDKCIPGLALTAIPGVLGNMLDSKSTKVTAIRVRGADAQGAPDTDWKQFPLEIEVDYMDVAVDFVTCEMGKWLNRTAAIAYSDLFTTDGDFACVWYDRSCNGSYVPWACSVESFDGKLGIALPMSSCSGREAVAISIVDTALTDETHAVVSATAPVWAQAPQF